MTTRLASELKNPNAKKSQPEIATEASRLFYQITVNCLRCSHCTIVKVESTKIPPAIMHILLSTRWDDRNWPFSEIGRPINNDPDDIEKKLILQALIEPETRFSYSEEGTAKKCANTCTIPSMLEKIDFDSKGVPKLGFLRTLDTITAGKSLDKTVAKHDDLIGPVVTYDPADSITNYVSFSVFEEWIVLHNKKKK